MARKTSMLFPSLVPTGADVPSRVGGPAPYRLVPMVRTTKKRAFEKIQADRERELAEQELSWQRGRALYEIEQGTATEVQRAFVAGIPHDLAVMYKIEFILAEQRAGAEYGVDWKTYYEARKQAEAEVRAERQQ